MTPDPPGQRKPGEIGQNLESLAQAIDSKDGNWLINFAGVTTVSSQSLALLMRSLRTNDNAGCRHAAYNVGTRLEMIFKTIKMEHFLPWFDNEPDAIASLSKDTGPMPPGS